MDFLRFLEQKRLFL